MYIGGVPGGSAAGRRIYEQGLAYQREKERREREAEEAAKAAAKAEAEERRRGLIQRMRREQKPIWRDWLLVDGDPEEEVVLRIVLSKTMRLFRVSRKTVTSRKARHRQAVAARHYAMQQIRDEFGWSFPRIGRALGGWDHTTVLSAMSEKCRNRVAEWLVDNRPGIAGAS